MGDIQSMLNKMGMGNMAGMAGAGAKLNMGAMEAQLNRNMKAAKMKERFREKAESNRVAREKMAQESNVSNVQTPESLADALLKDEQLMAIFNAGEKAVRTPRGGAPQQNTQNNNNNNKKKKKTKK